MGGDLLAGEAAFEVGGGPDELRGEQLVTPANGYQALVNIKDNLVSRVGNDFVVCG